MTIKETSKCRYLKRFDVSLQTYDSASEIMTYQISVALPEKEETKTQETLFH